MYGEAGICAHCEARFMGKTLTDRCCCTVNKCGDALLAYAPLSAIPVALLNELVRQHHLATFIGIHLHATSPPRVHTTNQSIKDHKHKELRYTIQYIRCRPRP